MLCWHHWLTVTALAGSMRAGLAVCIYARSRTLDSIDSHKYVCYVGFCACLASKHRQAALKHVS